MQKAKQKYFKDRSVYYSSFPIQQQGNKRKWNFQLKSVYTISILDFVFDEIKDDDEVFHHEVKMVDIKTNKVFYDKLTYIYLEMPKFNKTEDELETHFEKWLYVLKNLHKLTDRPAKLQERVFKNLFETSELKNLSQIEREAYHESLKHYRDLKNTIDTAFEEGYDEAIELMNEQLKQAEEEKQKEAKARKQAEAEKQKEAKARKKAEAEKQKAEEEKQKMIELLRAAGISEEDIQAKLKND